MAEFANNYDCMRPNHYIFAIGNFWLFGQMFKDARFDIYTATAFIFVIIAAINYIMINLALTLSSGVITNLLTIMIIGGMLFRC